MKKRWTVICVGGGQVEWEVLNIRQMYRQVALRLIRFFTRRKIRVCFAGLLLRGHKQGCLVPTKCKVSLTNRVTEFTNLKKKRFLVKTNEANFPSTLSFYFIITSWFSHASDVQKTFFIMLTAFCRRISWPLFSISLSECLKHCCIPPYNEALTQVFKLIFLQCMYTGT